MMDGKEGFLGSLRFSLTAHRVVDGRRGGEFAGGRGQAKRKADPDTEVLLALNALGRRLRELPPPADRQERRSTLMRQVALSPAAGATEPGRTRPTTIRPGLRVLAAAGVALIVALAAFVILGFASVNAMPGDPLYSVKRFMESARVAFTFGHEAKANAELEQAEKRLKELQYAEAKGMSDWYFSLAMDTLYALDDAQDELASITGSKQEPIVSRSKSVASSFSTQVQPALQEMKSEQQRRVEEEKLRVEKEIYQQKQPLPQESKPVQQPQETKPVQQPQETKPGQPPPQETKPGEPPPQETKPGQPPQEKEKPL